MGAFSALIDLAPDEGCDRGTLRRMAAASRHASLRTAPEVGTAGFALASPLWTSAAGLWVAADARLDERDELRTSLASWLAVPSASPSDAELILAAYLRWGDECPRHLLGDFAFLIWDSARRKLLAARDPLGVRLLHYARFGRRIAVASEVAPLLACPGLSREMDPILIGEYLTGHVVSLERTFFQNVRKLPPGHLWRVDPRHESVERFWDVSLDHRTVYKRDEEYAEHFRQVLGRAVRDRLPAGSATVGLALSGGLDSGSVATLARQHVGPDSPQRLLACSFLFPTLPCNEQPYISSLAASLGLDVLPIEGERHWFLGDRKAYTPGPESPALSWDGLYLEMTRLFQEKGVEVVLTGHGGDDLLRGSHRHYAERFRDGDLRSAVEVARHSWRRGSWRPLYRCLVSPLLPRRADLLLRRLTRRRSSSPSVPPWIAPGFARRTHLQERIRASWEAPEHGLSARQELHYHLVVRPLYARSMDWYDRVGAPCGIEFRHPFLDRRLVELVLSFPSRQLVQLGTNKPLIRRAMAGHLPDAVRLRPDKSKLGGFVDWSLRDKAAPDIERLFQRPVAAEMGFLDSDALRQAFQAYRGGDADEGKRALWYAVTLELWLREHGEMLQNPWGGMVKAA